MGKLEQNGNIQYQIYKMLTSKTLTVCSPLNCIGNFVHLCKMSPFGRDVVQRRDKIQTIIILDQNNVH